MDKDHGPTHGSLFAGIGGFDLGFEAAGVRTAWQVEIDPVNRAVLGHRFPDAQQFADVNHVGAHNLPAVDCITGGFPCQDISTAGYSARDKTRRGLNGPRSGLFWEVIRILKELQPAWVVLENVPALLHSNDCKDMETVIRSLADCGYVGYWRVLDAYYFGSPSRRRRLFLVAGFGCFPPMDFLADAGPMEDVSSAFGQGSQLCEADSWPGYALLASNTPARLSLGSELLVAQQNGWHQMVERARASENHGLCRGLDETNTTEVKAAGNAVLPAVARWIAEKLFRGETDGQ